MGRGLGGWCEGVHELNIYLDESGDLGFSQGSSKYFTIAFVVVKDPVLFARCVKETKIRYKIPRKVELKGSTAREVVKKDLLNKLRKLDIEIHAITVKKKNIDARLRKDKNILYNYIVGLLLVDCILAKPAGTKVLINVDRRVISVTSGFKFNEYLKYKIWYENARQDIDLEVRHLYSHTKHSIQGIDVICNSLFRKYNSNNPTLFNIIKDKVKCEKRLFFSK